MDWLLHWYYVPRRLSKSTRISFLSRTSKVLPMLGFIGIWFQNESKWYVWVRGTTVYHLFTSLFRVFCLTDVSVILRKTYLLLISVVPPVRFVCLGPRCHALPLQHKVCRGSVDSPQKEWIGNFCFFKIWQDLCLDADGGNGRLAVWTASGPL